MHQILLTAPLWVGLVLAVVIGGVAEVWGISNPESIIRFARGRDRLFLACIILCAAFGSLLLFLLHTLGFNMHFSPKSVYVVGVALGGVIFGIGLAISGYAPGAEWMALGEGRKDALYAIPGGILGALAWTWLYQTAVGQWLVKTWNFGPLTLAGNLAKTTPSITLEIAIPYAVVMFLIAYFLPRYRGGRRSSLQQARQTELDPKEQAMRQSTIDYLTEGGLGYKPGSLAAKVTEEGTAEDNFYSRTLVMISFVVAIMVVLGILLHQIFGMSTTFSWFAGWLLAPHMAYSQRVFQHVGWEPFSDLGVLVGAFLAAIFVSRRFTSFKPIIPPSWRNRFGDSQLKRAIGSFGGSFLVMFGARMAGGCASGHMLSGAIQMSISGWLFTLAVISSMLVTARWVYGECSMETHPQRQTATVKSHDKRLDFVRNETSPMVKHHPALNVVFVLGTLASIAVAAVITHNTGTIPLTLAQWVASATIPLLMLLGAGIYYSQPESRT